MTKTRILVLCTGNSARSQMGEGLFRAEGGPGYEMSSAGTRPSRVRPGAVAVMREIGIVSRATARNRSMSSPHKRSISW